MHISVWQTCNSINTLIFLAKQFYDYINGLAVQMDVLTVADSTWILYIILVDQIKQNIVNSHIIGEGWNTWMWHLWQINLSVQYW